jgi:nucleotide-binding universal stress UspA family protein
MKSLDSAKTVLCPFDFTPACRVSLAESARLAKRLGANLHVLHVLVTPPIVVLTPTESLAAPAIDQTSFVKSVETKRSPEIQAELDRTGVSGVAAKITFRDALHADVAILEFADAEHVDLIVMAKHAKAALSRFLLGSITERVLRHAKCPVLVIPVPGDKKP